MKREELEIDLCVWAAMGFDAGWRKSKVHSIGKKWINLIFYDNKGHYKGKGKREPEFLFPRDPLLNDKPAKTYRDTLINLKKESEK